VKMEGWSKNYVKTGGCASLQCCQDHDTDHEARPSMAPIGRHGEDVQTSTGSAQPARCIHGHRPLMQTRTRKHANTIRWTLLECRNSESHALKMRENENWGILHGLDSARDHHENKARNPRYYRHRTRCAWYKRAVLQMLEAEGLEVEVWNTALLSRKRGINSQYW
jgi:hypothetical protein